MTSAGIFSCNLNNEVQPIMSNHTYARRLKMPILNINSIKQIIFNDIKHSIELDKLDADEKQCFHIVGPAGVGKTQIIYQIADSLSKHFKIDFNIKKINSPVLSRDDFLVPYPVSDNSFKMLYSQFIPSENEQYGIFVIDEATRGDDQLQQMMWQIQNEYRLHTYEFPRGWFVVTIDNPDDDNYQINNMEDAAGLRRCLHMYVKVSARDFINYAIENKLHPLVISYIKMHPEKLYDYESQKQGGIYANPASWEKISNHLYKYNDNINDNINVIEILCGGLINIFESKLFTEFILDNNAILIKPDDIFKNYDNVRKHIKKFVREKNNKKIYEILQSFISYLSNNRPDQNEKNIDNILNFLLDLPMDIAASFVTTINTMQTGSIEHLYFMNLLIELNNKSDDFKKNFFDKLINLGS